MEVTKYSVHKIWFFYTDEWNAPSNTLAANMGVFDSLEEAEAAKKKLDIEYLRKQGKFDYLRNLMGFMDQSKEEPHPFTRLIEYVKSVGLDDDIAVHATDEQLWEIIKISNAYFHRIVPYTNVKKFTYVKFNPNFWEWKTLQNLEQQGVLGSKYSGSVYYPPDKDDIYLLNDATPGYSIAKYLNLEEAQKAALTVTLHYLNIFPESVALYNTPIADLSESLPLLQSYLQNCHTIKLDSSGENLNLSQTQHIDLNEFRGLLELLKVRPFEIEHFLAEVNGETVSEYDNSCYNF